MAEIAIKAKSVGQWQQDDIVDAFCECCIAINALQRICFAQTHQRVLSAAVEGIIPVDHVSQDYLEMTSQLRFERLSKTRGKVTRLSDGNEIEFDDGVKFAQHDGREVHMAMGPVIARKIKAAQYPIFGSPGNEIWYGGRMSHDDAVVSSVWDAVETKTPERRTDTQHTQWQFGSQDKRSNLVLLSVPFDYPEQAKLQESQFETDHNGDYKWTTTNEDEAVDIHWGQEAPDDERSWDQVTVAKRRNQINEPDSLLAAVGISRADVQNPNIEIDKRDVMIPLDDLTGFYDKVTEAPRERFEANRVSGPVGIH